MTKTIWEDDIQTINNEIDNSEWNKWNTLVLELENARKEINNIINL